MAFLLTLVAHLVLDLHNCFTQHVEVRLVCAEPKHNQVCVCSVNAVTDVWVVALLGTLGTDKVENFVLSFARNEGI